MGFIWHHPFEALAFLIILQIAWTYTGWKQKKEEDTNEVLQNTDTHLADAREIQNKLIASAEMKASELRNRLSHELPGATVHVGMDAFGRPELKVKVTNPADEALASRLKREIINS